MSRKIRILIVDNHAMMRLALSEAIERESDLCIAGEADCEPQALRLFRELRPDVVTMDFKDSGRIATETTRKIRKEFPDARIIMLSAFDGEEDIWRAVTAGVVGYLSKPADSVDIFKAIREVDRGKSYFPPAIAKRIAARRRRPDLTARELQVLRMVAAGSSNKKIMRALKISEGMVKLHVSNILGKLEVSDRTQAAIQAIRRGIVHLDDLPEG